MSGALPSAGRITVGGLIHLASQACALTVDEINGGCRERRFIRARMAVVHCARQAKYSYSDIGRRLGERDHSTVRNLAFKAEVWRGQDPLFDRIMDTMEHGIEAGLASRPITPFLVAETKPVRALDDIDLADYRLRHEMQAASDCLLRALRRAA